ncbi:MAG: hypothetical protein ABIP53_06420 [Candidatus Limnocylindrales bacterium]
MRRGRFVGADFLTYVHTGLNRANLSAGEMGPQRARPWRGNLRSGNAAGQSAGRPRPTGGDTSGGYIRINLSNSRWWERP